MGVVGNAVTVSGSLAKYPLVDTNTVLPAPCRDN